ncbi:MAG: transglutaminase domain-containing protein, partial [Rubripirellula sp.]|nr:transglutaminase domain-containing protein [Rubripirellula sp.]
PERTDFFFGNLPPDRIVLSVGRDLNLSPQQKAAPVNFLVYPYVEVEGVPHSEFRKEFRFDNLRIQ